MGYVSLVAVAAIVQERRTSLPSSLRRGFKLLLARWKEAILAHVFFMIYYTFVALVTVCPLAFIIALVVLATTHLHMTPQVMKMLFSPILALSDVIGCALGACNLAVFYSYASEGELPMLEGSRLPEDTWETRPSPLAP